MVFDRDYLLANLEGDRELLVEIIATFRSSSEGLLESIRKAATAGESKTLERDAHQLKGALANVGARSASAAAARLERLGRGLESGNVAAAVDELMREMDHLGPELDSLTGGA